MTTPRQFGAWTADEHRMLALWKQFWPVKTDWHSAAWGPSCSLVPWLDWARSGPDWQILELTFTHIDKAGCDKFGPGLAYAKRVYADLYSLKRETGPTINTPPAGPRVEVDVSALARDRLGPEYEAWKRRAGR